MQCEYCLSENAEEYIGQTNRERHYFCDQDCARAFSRDRSQGDIEHNLRCSIESVQSLKQTIKDTDEDLLFYKQHLKTTFAGKLFFESLLKRDSCEVITKFHDLYINNLENLLTIMFDEDLKDKYPSLFYHSGRLLTPEMRQSLKKAIYNYSKKN